MHGFLGILAIFSQNYQVTLVPWLLQRLALLQGCQTVYIQTKNPNLGIFYRVLGCKMLVNFMTIWNILRPYGIFNGRLS
jgi:hypothetical protein